MKTQKTKKGLHGLRSGHKPDLERVLKTTSRFGNKFFIACQAIAGAGSLRCFPGYDYGFIEVLYLPFGSKREISRIFSKTFQVVKTEIFRKKKLPMMQSR